MHDAEMNEKAYSEWTANFIKSLQGQKALKMLESMKSHSELLYPKLKEEVLIACFQADQFKKSGDDYDVRRESYSQLGAKPRTKNNDIIEHINFVMKYLTEHKAHYPDLIQEGRLFSSMSENYVPLLDLSEYPASQSGHHLNQVLHVLNDYRSAILALRSNESFYCFREEAWVYGNLRLSKRIDEKNQNRKPEAATCLMFQLSFFFKAWTVDPNALFSDDVSQLLFSRGLEMPEIGEMQPEITAELVKATFPDAVLARTKASSEGLLITPSDVRQRMEKMSPKTKLLLWDRLGLPNFH